MNIISMPLTELKKNNKNPRLIRDASFKKLVQSIQDFPEMLKLRPIIIDNDGRILGGNMRFEACKELKHKEVYVMKASDLTEEQKQEFIIKDNVNFGVWDFDILNAEWDKDLLDQWGLDSFATTDIDVDSFFEAAPSEDKEPTSKIVLEYTEEDYNKVIEAFKQYTGTKEQIVFKLLGL